MRLSLSVLLSCLAVSGCGGQAKRMSEYPYFIETLTTTMAKHGITDHFLSTCRTEHDFTPISIHEIPGSVCRRADKPGSGVCPDYTDSASR